MIRVLKVSLKVLSYFILALMVILAGLLAGPRLFSLKPYAVMSGSMEPAFPTGSIVYVQKADPLKIKVGDPITFYLEKTATVTHRVVRIDSKQRLFYTKGDANNTEDISPVSFKNLVG